MMVTRLSAFVLQVQHVVVPVSKPYAVPVEVIKHVRVPVPSKPEIVRVPEPYRVVYDPSSQHNHQLQAKESLHVTG